MTRLGKITFGKISVAGLLTMLCFSLITYDGAAGAAPNEWILNQSSDMGGIATAYVSRNAIAFKTEKMGCRLVCKAPDWKVHCFQDKERLEWVGDLKVFTGAVMGNPYKVPKDPMPIALKLFKSGEFQGLKYSIYKPSPASSYMVCYANDILLAPRASEFFCRLYGTPVMGKAPLFSSSERAGIAIAADAKKRKFIDYDSATDMRKGKVEVLRTVSWKSVPYNPSDFELTKNCRRVADIIQVTFSSAKKHELDDMFDNVGFTTKFEKSGGPAK